MWRTAWSERCDGALTLSVETRWMDSRPCVKLFGMAFPEECATAVLAVSRAGSVALFPWSRFQKRTISNGPFFGCGSAAARGVAGVDRGAGTAPRGWGTD